MDTSTSGAVGVDTPLRALVQLLPSQTAPVAAPPLPPAPVPTVDMLRLVDALQSSFTRIVHLTAGSIPASSDAAQQQSSTTEDVKKELAQYRAIIAELQAAMRSKVHQTGRFALIHELSVEIQERQAAVSKMEAVLDIARQNI